MTRLKVAAICAGLFLVAGVGELDAERFAYTVGVDGPSWSELATRWVALDDTTTPGAIQPKELMPGENIMNGPAKEANIFGFAWHESKTGLESLGKELGLNPRVWGGGGLTALQADLILDGDLVTAFPTLFVVSLEEFNSHNTLTGSAFSAGFRLDTQEWFTFDLGIEMPVNRIRFFPRQSGLDSEGVPNVRRSPQGFELSVQRKPEERLLLGSEPNPVGALETVLLRTLLNAESIVDVEFPVQPLRFVRLNLGLVRQAYAIAEFEVFGMGVPPRAEYVSAPIDLGEPVNFGEIRFSLTLLRRTPDGDLVEDAAAPARLSLQTRSGSDDSPLSYFVINELGLDVEVTKQTYDRADDPKTCCVSLRLPGVRSAVTDDERNWTTWSSPYTRPGEQNRSGDGRRWLQFRFTLETDDVLAYVRLDTLSFEYSSLLARSVVGELSVADRPELEVIEVSVGEEQHFIFDIRAGFEGAGQSGFDAVRLDIPPDTRFERLEMGPAGTADAIFEEVVADSIREERTAITVFFPTNRIDRNNNRPLRIRLLASVFNSSTVFGGDVIDTESDNLPQSIDSGDANAAVMGNSLRVFATQARLAALAAVSVLPAVLTPNGDNVNDSVRISYRIQGIESGDVAIEILDLSGRTVRELSPGPRGQGTYVEDWNGTDESGVLVAPGVYLCRVAVSTQSGDEETLKLLPVAY